MSRQAALLTTAFASLFVGVGCTRTLPPPPAPPATLPSSLSESTPAEPATGMARVLISTDVPARVSQISKSIPAQRPRTYASLICESTPCSVTLPYGDHELLFEGLSDDARRGTTTVRVRRATEAVNHTLGQTSSSTGQWVGIGLLAIGSAVLGAAFGMGTFRGDSDGSAVQVLTIAGLGTVAAGGVTMAASPTTRQEGSTTQWSPAPLPAAVGPTIGGRF